jgi:hypothetical protein
MLVRRSQRSVSRAASRTVHPVPKRLVEDRRGAESAASRKDALLRVLDGADPPSDVYQRGHGFI